MASEDQSAAARQQLIERLERSYARLQESPERLGTPRTGMQKLLTLRSVIDRLKESPGSAPTGPLPAQPAAAAAVPEPATPTIPDARPVWSGPQITWQEFEAIFRFYEDAVDTLQQARYSVRFGKPLAAEPAYPADSHAVHAMLRRVLGELKPK